MLLLVIFTLEFQRPAREDNKLEKIMNEYDRARSLLKCFEFLSLEFLRKIFSIARRKEIR